MKVHNKKFRDWQISFVNEKEFTNIVDEIWVQKEYECDLGKKSPIILDVGSHIGLSILYFKEKYPRAKIIGFEPNPLTFNLLKRNVSQNHLTDIEVINAAIARAGGWAELYVDRNENDPWGWGDSLKKNKWNRSETSKTVKVHTAKLSDFISPEGVDLVKMDIEGAETEVVKEMSSKLNLVKLMILEFHGSVYNPQNNLKRLIELLVESGFRVKLVFKGRKVPDWLVGILAWFMGLIQIEQYWMMIYASR